MKSGNRIPNVNSDRKPKIYHLKANYSTNPQHKSRENVEKQLGTTKMSFPQFQHEKSRGKEYMIFTVPDHRVVDKITLDCQRNEVVRIQALAKSLSGRIEDLHDLLSHHELEAFSMDDRCELRIKLTRQPNSYEQFWYERKWVQARLYKQNSKRPEVWTYTEVFHGPSHFHKPLPALRTLHEEEER